MNIWFSSDFHYGQSNIVYGESTWKDKETSTRKFNTLSEHNEKLIQNINNVCKENDILYFTGDWSFGGRDNVHIFRKALNIKNIHFIGGNHDHHIRGNVLLNSHKGWINAQNLFSSYNEILEKKIGGEKMVLCHYPFAKFHKEHHGAINLYGHVHKDNTLYNKRGINICIDNHKEFRPFHLEEIKKIIKER